MGNSYSFSFVEHAILMDFYSTSRDFLLSENHEALDGPLECGVTEVNSLHPCCVVKFIISLRNKKW